MDVEKPGIYLSLLPDYLGVRKRSKKCSKEEATKSCEL